MIDSKNLKLYFVVLVGGVLVGSELHAGDPKAGCGGNCRLETIEKKLEITCWRCECEEFCVPGPSLPGCQHSEAVCDSPAGKKSWFSASKLFVWRNWTPGCAKVQSRKKLMRKTVVKKVPSHRWVAENPYWKGDSQ